MDQMPHASGQTIADVKLLSEVYEENNGVVPEETVADFLSKMARVNAAKNKNAAEKEFIADTVETMVKISQDKLKTSRQPTLQPELVQLKKTGAQTIKLNELVIRPEVFDGTRPKPRRWIEDYGEAIIANGWDDLIAVKYFPTFLTQSAKDWYVTDVRPKIYASTTWVDIHQMFTENFLGESDYEQLSQAVDNTRQRPGESISVFLPRIRRLMLMLTSNLPEKEQIRQIRTKLRPEYKALLAYAQPQSIVQLKESCLKIEAGFASRQINKDEQPRKGFVPRRSQNEGANRPKPGSSGSRPKSRFNKNRIVNHGKSPNTNQQDQIQCYKCDRPGHIAKECFAKSKKDGTAISDAKPRPTLRKVNLVESKSSETKDSDDEVITIRHTCNSVREGNPKMEIPKAESVNSIGNQCKFIETEIMCNDKPVKAVVDTGAYSTIINESVVKKNNWQMENSPHPLFGADGNHLSTCGIITAKIEIRIGKVSKVKVQKLIVVKHLTSQMLLGLELMKAMKLCVDTSKSQLTFLKDSINTGIRTCKEENLAPRSQTLIQARVNAVGEILTNPFNFSSEILIANSIAKVDKNKIPVLLLNHGNKTTTLPKGLQIATFEKFQEINDNQEVDKMVNQIIELEGTNEFINVGNELNDKQVLELKALLVEHKNAFSLDGNIGLVKHHEHVIELLPDAKPFAETLRRRAQVQIDETRKQVKDMLDKGIIEESTSPWASAYVLAKKKTGEMRLCIDFRKLNEVTKKWVYPLPNIEECLDTLCGKKYFSQIDFASGFWQIPVEKKSRELTAFRTEDGLYQFKRMPFGLTNAPASFQKMINVVLSGLKGMNLQVFIDDVCVATQTWEEHLSMLHKLLKLVEEANLKIKGSKCVFGANTITFLGHEISEQGIKQERSKLESLVRMPQPEDTKGVKRVLGMFSYYRKFVPNFAILAEPLTKLTRKGIDFQWNEEHQEAFKSIISKLEENATLAHFDHRKPTMLKTDASRKGIAGLLLQKHEDDWKMVSCCSRRLTTSEANYGITDLEGLAVVYSVTKLRPYLLGKHFQILVDHCALCVLNKRMPNSARLRRWAVVLSEYDFEIIYTKGDQHKDIDCLSRAPVDDSVDEFLDNKVYAIIPLDSADWISSYRDEESREIFQKAFDKEDNLKLVNDIIYKDDLLYVPTSKRDELIRLTHSAPMNAHPGIQATRAKLAENYWWPKMTDDVTRIVKLCGTCLVNKPERLRPAGQMHSFEIYEAGKQVAIDCLGPLTESLSGNKHVIVAIDMFTRFVDAKAVPDIQAPTFTQFLIEHCGRYGVPNTIQTDRSTTFCNEFTSEVLKVFGANHVKSTPYHSQGNAVVERVIQTLQEKLRLVLDDPLQETNWDAALPIAVLAINTAYHTSIGHTPYEMTFGRRPPLQDKSITRNVTPHDMHAKLINAYMKECRADAIAIQSVSQENSKERYNRLHRDIRYHLNDLVSIKTPDRSSKLSPKYKGPYKVVGIQDDVYKLEQLSTGKVYSRHVSDLKLVVQERNNQNNDANVNVENQVNLCSSQIDHKEGLYKKRKNNKMTLFDLLLLIIVAFSITPELISAQHYFQRVKPLVWVTTPYEVSLGIAEYDIDFYYHDPCEIWLQTIERDPSVNIVKDKKNYEDSARKVEDSSYQMNQNGTRPPLREVFQNSPFTMYYYTCKQLYTEHWERHITELLKVDFVSNKIPEHLLIPTGNKKDEDSKFFPDDEKTIQKGSANEKGLERKKRNILLVPYLLGLLGYHVGNLVYKLDKLDNVTKTNEQLEKQLTNHTETKQLVKQLEANVTTLTKKWEERKPKPVTLQELERKKRQVLEAVAVAVSTQIVKQGVGLIAATVTSNLISSVWNRIWSGGSASKTEIIMQQQEKMNKNFDIIKETLAGTIQSVSTLSEQFTSTLTKIKDLFKKNTKYTQTAQLVSGRILSQSQDLLRVIDTAKDGKVHTHALSRLLNYPLLDHFKRKDTKFLSVTSVGPSHINLRFNVNIKAPDTFVYALRALKHWDNLASDSEPVFKAYHGADFVIYNETSNCIKPVERPLFGDIINDECIEQDGENPQLSKWEVERTGNVSSTADESQMIQTAEYNYVYCFPGKIIINNSSYRCPLEPFKLKKQVSFRTAEHSHTFRAMRYNFTQNLAVDVVHAGHFDDDSDVVNELKMYDKLNELKERLKEINTETVVVEKSNFLYVALGAAFTPIASILVYCFCVNYGYKLFICMFCNLRSKTGYSNCNRESIPMSQRK